MSDLADFSDNAEADQPFDESGFCLPKPAVPQGHYLSYVLSGDQLVISGQGPRRQGRLKRVGRVGEDVTLDEARREAEICALNVLSQAAAALSGDLGRIVQTIKVNGFINTSATFTQHTAVIDAASSVLTAILGERGHHARTAVGVASLPSGMAVEIDATFKVVAHQHASTPHPSKARHDVN
jgi:enamine deaminase RidA (YjgF/YER057c/UK114 family)